MLSCIAKTVPHSVTVFILKVIPKSVLILYTLIHLISLIFQPQIQLKYIYLAKTKCNLFYGQFISKELHEMNKKFVLRESYSL